MRPSTPPVQPRPVVVESAQPQYQQPQAQQVLPQKAKSITGSSTCPECASGNYMQQAGGRARCYDCGYPIIQTTSGMMPDPGTPKQAAQQVETTYNPTIEGRIG